MYENEISQAQKLAAETNAAYDDLNSKISKLCEEIYSIRAK